MPPSVNPDQLDSVLASAADFLHRQGVGEGAAAVDDARKEIARLRWALREACDTAWSDGEAAMAQYLRRAESAPFDESQRGMEAGDGNC